MPTRTAVGMAPEPNREPTSEDVGHPADDVMADGEALTITETADGVLIPVKVVPGASRDRIAGVLDGALKVQVSAPPEKGKANKAVVALLAEALGVRKNQVAVVQGRTTPHKTIAAVGVAPAAVRRLVE